MSVNFYVSLGIIVAFFAIGVVVGHLVEKSPYTPWGSEKKVQDDKTKEEIENFNNENN